MAAIEKGTKPARKAPDFNRFDAGNKNKDLNEVMQIEDKKTKASAENKAKGKETFEVKKIFKSTDAQRKKARAVK